jgi:hypothetical protein
VQHELLVGIGLDSVGGVTAGFFDIQQHAHTAERGVGVQDVDALQIDRSGDVGVELGRQRRAEHISCGWEGALERNQRTKSLKKKNAEQLSNPPNSKLRYQSHMIIHP